MSDLLFDLEGAPGSARGKSRIEEVLSALTEEERPVVEKMLDPSGPPAEWLAHTLRKHGHQLSASTIKAYRRNLRLGA